MAYTSGFSPRPKLSFGLALPTGCESLAEYLDVELADSGTRLRDLGSVLEGQFPAGIEITAACGARATAGARFSRTSPRAPGRSRLPGYERHTLESLVRRALAAPSLPVRGSAKGARRKTTSGRLFASLQFAAISQEGLCSQSGARHPSRGVCDPPSLGGLSGSSSDSPQDPSVDRERGLSVRASRTGRSSAASGLGACVVTSSRRDLPNVRQPLPKYGERTTGTGGPGT